MASANLEIIQERVRKDRYLIKTHALIHALKEGFERKDMVMAVLDGTIIEDYDDDRALICGTAKLSESVEVYLHVVCEYTDPFYVEFVTAYIPDELQWERPPVRRRKMRL
jgi:hypothetical protein